MFAALFEVACSEFQRHIFAMWRRDWLGLWRWQDAIVWYVLRNTNSGSSDDAYSLVQAVEPYNVEWVLNELPPVQGRGGSPLGFRLVGMGLGFRR